MEITPHDSLFIEEDEEKRQKEMEQAMMFAHLAAQDDLMQKYGGEGYPNWEPEKHGPRTPGEEAEWTKGGYKRKENGLWVDENDQPLTGRQFEGKHPPGYAPGQGPGNYAADGKTYGADGKIHGTAVGQGQLHSAGGKYGRDAEKVWEQPSWTKMKLRSTGTGSAIRKGDYDAEGKIINKGDGGALEKGDGADPEAATEEQVEDPENSGLKRIRRTRVSKIVSVKKEPAWVKARREKAEAAAAAGEEVVQNEEEEIIEDEYEEEEYEEEEIIEEIVIEDEDGNIIEEEEGLDGGSTHDVSALQKTLAKRANEQKLLE
jgi:hypothetical protein